MSMPPLPPIPDRDVDWTTFPNEWDLEYMKYREELEAFAKALRAQVREWQLVPVSEYKEGSLEVKWDGEMHPVSKGFYGWLHAHEFGKEGGLSRALLDAILARLGYARKRG